MEKPDTQDKELRRAAVFLVSAPDAVSSQILNHLDKATAQKISAEISKLKDLAPAEREEAIREFMLVLVGDDPANASKLIRRWANARIKIDFPRFTI